MCASGLQFARCMALNALNLVQYKPLGFVHEPNLHNLKAKCTQTLQICTIIFEVYEKATIFDYKDAYENAD